MPINKDTPTSEIIHDFVKSKNPKFAGKSKAERVKQAVAASYKVHGEEVEESNNTPYVRKSKTNPNAWDAMNKHGKVKTFGAEFKDSAMRHAGLTNEEVEHIDEIFSDGPEKFTDDHPAQKEFYSRLKSEAHPFLNTSFRKYADKRDSIKNEVAKKHNVDPKSFSDFSSDDISNLTGRKSTKEETELEEARGRPKKDLGYTINPNNKEKLYHDNPEHMDRIRRLRKNGVLPPEQHAPSEHIINILRQASTNQTGGQDIKYENGKTHHVSGSMASKTLDHYNSLPKPADKEAFQAKIRKSHEEHKSSLGEEVMSEETKAPLWGVSSSNKFRNLEEMDKSPETKFDRAGQDRAKDKTATPIGAKKFVKDAESAMNKSFSKEEAELEEKKLIGKQKKLDKNDNGHLDAEDFKMLRKEELMSLFADALEEGIFDESDIDRRVEKELENLEVQILNLEELSKGTLGSYVKKATVDVHNNAYNAGKKEGSGKRFDQEKLMNGFGRQIGIQKAVTKLAKEETISESNEQKVTPYTAASRYHAVESAVRDIMSQNQNLKKIAEEETFRRNNPGLFKDK